MCPHGMAASPSTTTTLIDINIYTYEYKTLCEHTRIRAADSRATDEDAEAWQLVASRADEAHKGQWR
jgi:hypothetical protein